MSGRLVRSKTAEQVAQLLGSRDGRKHLARYGWEPGMPVVMAHPQELAEDVMGLVSTHDCAVLIAMFDPLAQQLSFLHVCPPNAALQIEEEMTPGTGIGFLFDAAQTAGSLVFRVRYWKYSAVAHPVPVYLPVQ